jgi:hypothetical protein
MSFRSHPLRSTHKLYKLHVTFPPSPPPVEVGQQEQVPNLSYLQTVEEAEQVLSQLL